MQRDIFRKVALDRLSTPEQLDQLMRVTSPAGWLALAVLGSLLVLAVGWSIWGTIRLAMPAQAIIAPSGSDTGAGSASFHAVLFVPAAVQQQVRPGMQVRFHPPDARNEAGDDVRGTIAAVEPALSTADMGQAAGGDAAAQTTSSNSPVVALLVALTPELPQDRSQARLQSVDPPTFAQAGTLVDVTVVLAELHPISFVLPTQDGR